MKNYFLILLFFNFIHALYAQNDSLKIQTAVTDSIHYTCPMHPEVISVQPGKCPKCGMELVQKTSSSSEHKMDMMMCPMHGMVNMNHKHDEEKKKGKNMMKGMGIGMGVMMVGMMALMVLLIML